MRAAGKAIRVYFGFFNHRSGPPPFVCPIMHADRCWHGDGFFAGKANRFG